MQQVSQVMDFNCADGAWWSGNLTQLQGMGERERKRFYLLVTSIGMSHRDCFQGSSHHEFSFCGDVGTAIQDLPDLSHRLLPNFEHDQYLNFDLFFYIQGICKFDHVQVNNQQVLEVVCISLFQNLGDFQLLDH
jgi:hypothetical protein